MRILWIVNLLLPQLSKELGTRNSSSGTWLFEWSKKISKTNNPFAVVCVYGKEFKKITVDGIIFYLLPGNGKNMLFYTKKYEKLWKKIVDDFKPDIINIHGTEYCHGLACMRAKPNENYIISMQGIISKIKEEDYGGLTKKEVFFCRTFKESIKFNGIFENHLLHKKGAKYEKEMLSKCNYIACANDWDKSCAWLINPNAKLFCVDYDMQVVFKESKKWSVDSFKKHQIFTNPGGTPLKGIHQLFRAVSLLIKKYPDLKVVVPGMGNNGELIIKNGYSKFINKLINRLKIKDNVLFLGYQTTQEMCDNMLQSNVVVIPSSIEGTSLILRESMYLGCPTISSFRGGMANYITHDKNGFAYDFKEYQYLALLIDKVFELSDEDLERISLGAISKTSYYDTNHSFESLMNMYTAVFNDSH